jgi:hypothetical protein
MTAEKVNKRLLFVSSINTEKQMGMEKEKENIFANVFVSYVVRERGDARGLSKNKKISFP